MCDYFSGNQYRICVPPMSLKKDLRVADCFDYTSKMCESLTCMAPGGEGVGFCIDPIVSNINFVNHCKSNKDCMGHADSFTFDGKCECGLNAKA
mmetsp:Transcript_9875/g.1462  ORF Transcript_9875/g.1462 Transcript_9875/m.1462 type:complete len:94 (+) Transcript_9875:455-736(+)